MARIIKAGQFDQAEGSRAAALRLQEMAAEVRDVVLDARKQAARIITDAREQSQIIQLQASESGHEEGFERGRREGAAAGELKAYETMKTQLREETRDLAPLAKRMTDALAAAASRRGGDLADEVLELAIALARRIVRRLAVSDVGPARESLAKALDLVMARGPVRVLVNPGQLDALGRYCEEFIDGLGESATVELAGDTSISPGGVKILAGGGEIDATVETQLANVADALLAGRDRSAGTYESHSRAQTVSPLQLQDMT